MKSIIVLASISAVALAALIGQHAIFTAVWPVATLLVASCGIKALSNRLFAGR